ncbi:hypothetical protein [Galactobacter valiniphilus]|uniref:hypothetical protein n=1 Tax=Galactobacter valiniphilus TaxID=2676122 RepID=UPI003735BE66
MPSIEQYIEDKGQGGPDKRAQLAYEFLSGVMSSLTLEKGEGQAAGRSVKAETFEGWPVFTYSDPASTLHIAQERPYRLVSVSQNKPSADGSQIKLIYFAEEGKLTHPLSAPAGQDLAPGSARRSYRLALIEAKLDRIEDSLGGK